MFRVDWLESALDELTTIWTGADSSVRSIVTAATHSIEQRLRSDAPTEGESRPDGRRIIFAAPLAVTYQMDSDGATATVLHVRLYRHRAK